MRVAMFGSSFGCSMASIDAWKLIGAGYMAMSVYDPSSFI
jgi:hypothetical protein